MAYLGDRKRFSDKVYSIFPSVEKVGDRLMGVFTCQICGKFDSNEYDELLQELRGQASDEWGESFKQHEIHTPEGDIYVSMDYSPTDLSSLINEMGLSADGLTGEAYTGSQLRKDIDKSSIWALITADTSLPNVYSGTAETDSAVKLIYRKDYVSGSLSVTENGQLICELCGIRSCYDIGRNSAEAVISALSQEQ